MLQYFNVESNPLSPNLFGLWPFKSKSTHDPKLKLLDFSYSMGFRDLKRQSDPLFHNKKKVREEPGKHNMCSGCFLLISYLFMSWPSRFIIANPSRDPCTKCHSERFSFKTKRGKQQLILLISCLARNINQWNHWLWCLVGVKTCRLMGPRARPSLPNCVSFCPLLELNAKF